MDFDSIFGSVASVLKGMADQFNDALRKEYERGLEEGRRQASEEMRARITNAIGGPLTVVIKTPVSATAIEMASQSRSPRGSVEPKVLGALSNSPKGKKPSEIAAETGVPENSVRGMLNKLRKDERVAKHGEVWALPKYDDLFGSDEEESTVSTTSTPEESGNPDAGASGLFK
jgi:hypothetical protein